MQTLNSSPRISANPNAMAYLARNISFNGDISVPVLTMHTTGDGLVVPENEQAYRSVVDRAGHGNLLRQVFVNRAGHCAFTPAETITAVQTLENRMSTGQWNVPSPAAMNAQAAALDANRSKPATTSSRWQPVRPTPPAFISYTPARYLRPFDLFGWTGSQPPFPVPSATPTKKVKRFYRPNGPACPPRSWWLATRPRPPPSGCTEDPGRTARSPRRCSASPRSRTARRGARTGPG